MLSPEEVRKEFEKAVSKNMDWPALFDTYNAIADEHKMVKQTDQGCMSCRQKVRQGLERVYLKGLKPKAMPVSKEKKTPEVMVTRKLSAFAIEKFNAGKSPVIPNIGRISLSMVQDNPNLLDSLSQNGYHDWVEVTVDGLPDVTHAVDHDDLPSRVLLAA